MSDVSILTSDCGAACTPVILKLKCPPADPNALKQNYQLTVSGPVVLTRPPDQTSIGGICFNFSNPLFLGCNKIDLDATYPDKEAYVRDITKDQEFLAVAGQPLSIVLCDLNQDGSPVLDSDGNPVESLPFGTLGSTGQYENTLNKFGSKSCTIAKTTLLSQCVDLSAFTGCQMAAKINGEIYMTLADGLKFCKPPNGCSVQCGSIFALPSSFSTLQLDDPVLASSFTAGQTTITYSAVPFVEGVAGPPVTGSKAIFNGNAVPITGSDVTVTLVSGTWTDGTNTGTVTGITYDPSVPQFTVTIDAQFQAGLNYEISLSLNVCEVECPENCTQYVLVVTASDA